jgi:hypothetical protein
VEWTRPINLFKIRSFLDLLVVTNFIQGFLKLSGPLIALTMLAMFGRTSVKRVFKS